MVLCRICDVKADLHVLIPDLQSELFLTVVSQY